MFDIFFLEYNFIGIIIFFCFCFIVRNFSLLLLNFDFLVSFIKLLVGFDLGLRMKMIGENGLDCLNIVLKLIIGGVMYFLFIFFVMKFVMVR